MLSSLSDICSLAFTHATFHRRPPSLLVPMVVLVAYPRLWQAKVVEAILKRDQDVITIDSLLQAQKYEFFGIHQVDLNNRLSTARRLRLICVTRYTRWLWCLPISCARLSVAFASDLSKFGICIITLTRAWVGCCFSLLVTCRKFYLQKIIYPKKLLFHLTLIDKLIASEKWNTFYYHELIMTHSVENGSESHDWRVRR